LEKSWLSILESSEEAADTEWSHSTFLSIFLLVLSDTLCYVFNSWLIFEVESEGLALHSCFIDDNSGISLETSKRAHDMIVNFDYFPYASGILEVTNRFLLNSKDDCVISLDSDSGGPLVDSLKSIFNLKKFTVWSEDSDGFIVGRHFILYFY
jgi:hypothetical protein